MFDASAEIERIKRYTLQWFNRNGPNTTAVIGISGGKDSTVVVALMTYILGKDRVLGVLMPNGEQADINDSYKVVSSLNINSMTVNIQDTVNSLMNSFEMDISEDTKINIPPRIRMTVLYAVAQSLPNGGRVINTCNLSEDYIGYSTKYGDSAGDFAPIADYTVTEVLEIGKKLINLDMNIPINLIYKTPSDGLCGLSDEDKLGFTYEVLDKYIRTGICEDISIKEKINHLHKINKHKLQVIPKISYEGGYYEY